jgi:hypothetical protein
LIEPHDAAGLGQAEAPWSSTDPAHVDPAFTFLAQAVPMSMAEPLMPHPETPDTAFDERSDAPVPEPHGEPAEANESPASGQGDAPNDLNDNLPLPNFPPDGDVSADDLNGEAPD